MCVCICCYWCCCLLQFFSCVCQCSTYFIPAYCFIVFVLEEILRKATQKFEAKSFNSKPTKGGGKLCSIVLNIFLEHQQNVPIIHIL